MVVYVAPGWHLDRHGLHFSREDLVMGTGVPVGDAKGSELFARSIEKGDIKVVAICDHVALLFLGQLNMRRPSDRR